MAMRAWIRPGNGQAYQEVSVTPNKPYIYTIWTLRDAGTLAGSFYIKLAWYNGASFISENSQTITVDSAIWTKQTLAAPAPLNANKVRVIFGSSNISLTGKFDDAELTAANIYYVRPDGNDANLGISNTPQGAFKTIQKAANMISPSDIVEVQAGTYNEQVIITRLGASGQLITFRANGQVIIDGQSTRPYCIKIDGADYIKIEGFTIRNATDNGILLINSANYNVLSNNTCHNNGASGIRLNNTSNYNTLLSNTCYSNGSGASAYGDRPCGIYLFNSSSYNTLDSNVCRNNPSTGIWLEGNSSYCALTNNKAYSNGYGGIIVAGGTNYNTVSYNLIYSNGSMGVDLSYGAHDNLFKNNAIYNNGGNGIQSNNAAYSNTLKNNIVFNNGLTSSSAYGINMASGCSAILAYNDVYNNGQGANRNYSGLSAGPGDISLDPLFKSTTSTDPNFLKLKSIAAGDALESPCIDSGSPSDTPSAQSGKRIDIGVYDLYQHSPIAGGLTAEYFDNMDLTALKLSRIDPRINFDWGNSSPDASIGVDTFSVRWQGQVKIDFAQNYTFSLITDDGSRLYIDNNLIIDKWFNQGTTEHFATISLTPGLHNIKYEYFENGAGAIAKLYWSAPSINKSLIPSDHLYYFGSLPQDKYIQGGLKGDYSKFTTLTVPPIYVLSRIDPRINFDWGTNMPDAALGQDLYQVKWKGRIRIPQADTYTFYTTTDDGVKLWVNNRILVDGWQNGASLERSGSIYLAPGLYDIELNYYDNTGSAVCKLLWSSPAITKQVIAPAFLYYKNDLMAEEGGLYAEYYDNKDLISPPKIKKIDPNIDFDWLVSGPDKLIEPDTFSIRWTGQVKADYAETYTFYANANDGMKLWVDNSQLINYGLNEITASITLTAGWHNIKVEYYDNDSHASARLFYSSPSTPKQAIPRDHLRTTLPAEEASLNFYSTLNSAQDVQTPYIGRPASIIQTGTGQVTFEWAKFGKGALLNGTTDGNNDELISFSPADLNKKEGTIEFWFKPNWNSNDGTAHYLLCSGWSWDGTIQIFKYSDNGLYWKIVKDGIQYSAVSNVSGLWTANTWHNLAASYGPAGMKIYFDYNKIAESAYTGALSDTFASDIYIGGTNSGTDPSNCVFDDLKIYNKQLIPSDTKPPIIAITSHQPNQVVNTPSITIQGTIDDNTATVIARSGSDEAIYPATVSNGAFTIGPIPLSVGPNTITVTAADQSSNISSKSIALTYVDITPPTTPTVNPVVSPANINTQTLSGAKEVNSSIRINGVERVALDGLTTWSKSVNLSEGINNFSITSKDASNNESAAAAATIFLDTTLPTGTIKINDNSQYTNSANVTLTLFATDTGTGVSQMQLSSPLWGEGQGEGQWLPAEPYTVTRPYVLSSGDGAKTVYAQFKDAAGNWSDPVSDDIILDTTAPVIAVTSPENGYISSAQTITVEGTIDDNTATVSVERIADSEGGPVIARSEATKQSNTTFTAQNVPLSLGQNTITATATDPAGNQATSNSITVLYDSTAPTAPVVTDDGDYTNSLTTIHAAWTSQDAESRIAEYQYSIGTTQGGIDVVGWTTPAIPTDTEVTRNDLTLVAGATYFINVKSRNNALPASPSTWSAVGSSNGIIVNGQATALAIEITSPAEGTRRVNTPTITVSGTVSDSTATVTVNGIPSTLGGEGQGEGTTFTASNIPLTQGTNIITATATKDTETAEDSIDVILDLDPPNINIYTPDANATTRSNIVYGRISDDTQTVTVNDTPADVIPAEAGIQARFIARPTLTEGPNTITVQAQDQAGNANQAQITFTYNTQTPKVTITSPEDNSTQDISPITVQGTSTSDISFILVNSVTALLSKLAKTK